MSHLSHLITDLALILGVAGITTLVFKKLKQPIILGYIVAGFLVGPNFKIFPSIVEVAAINLWAELGVIILLFSLGLEFSFKKPMKVGGGAVVTGIYEMAAMFGLGFAVASVFSDGR